MVKFLTARGENVRGARAASGEFRQLASELTRTPMAGVGTVPKQEAKPARLLEEGGAAARSTDRVRLLAVVSRSKQ